jgi:hypothetical protein
MSAEKGFRIVWRSDAVGEVGMIWWGLSKGVRVKGVLVFTTFEGGLKGVNCSSTILSTNSHAEVVAMSEEEIFPTGVSVWTLESANLGDALEEDCFVERCFSTLFGLTASVRNLIAFEFFDIAASILMSVERMVA